MTIHVRVQTLCAAAAFAVAINVALSAASGATIYVDGKLQANCKGNYSVAARDASGKDGDAYKTIVEAADVAKAGDTVLIRDGAYHTSVSMEENDVLWPKHSGEPNNPITFKAYKGEKAVLGDADEKYPGWDDKMAIAGGTITLKDVSYIVIEDLVVRKVTGWLYARNCDHVTVRNCIFSEGLHGSKGTVRLLECRYFRIQGCALLYAAYDAMQIETSDHNVIEDCTFNSAAHSLNAIRGSSYNVVRNCRFDNPYYKGNVPGHLTETYDMKVGKRDPNETTYAKPAYDSARYNLYERNIFGYDPIQNNHAAQMAAMEYSGQNGIIRNNVFCNPLDYRDPNTPGAAPGGYALTMRWGGSWDGWNANKQYWMGEGHEAGFVYGNRAFNNTFIGYDEGCVTIPSDNAMKNITVDPPPLENKNPPRQFEKKFTFEDNQFINNIFVPGLFCGHTNWAWHKHVTGKPVGVVVQGLLDKIKFVNNDFFAEGNNKDELIYIDTSYKYPPPVSPEKADKTYPDTFKGNLQKDPMFVDAKARDFRLKDGSPMIDAGAFLTVAVGAGKDSKELHVKDAGYFYDGFGIPGEKGDLIQLKGQKDAVRIVAVDYKTNTLKLEKAVTWADGDGVALPYAGAAPDIGAIENGLTADQTIGPNKPQ